MELQIEESDLRVFIDVVGFSKQIVQSIVILKKDWFVTSLVSRSQKLRDY